MAWGISRGRLDPNKFHKEYVETLKNTPIDEPITIEAISDEKLRELDKIRYTNGSRDLLAVIEENM